jgi:hypothetical protein
VIHKFRKERKRNSQNSQGYFECSDTTHFIADYLKRKKYDYSNKNDYNNKNDYKKKNQFSDKKKNIKKIMSRVCAALSDFDFSSEGSSSLEEDVKVSYPGSKKQNRSLHTGAQDVQITRMTTI